MTTRQDGSYLPTHIPLFLAWLGVFGSWIAHPTAALTQQGLDFAEWSTFLLDVRNGPMTLHPDLLRGAFGLIAVALCFAVEDIPNAWLRVMTRAGGFLTGILLLPPYPGGFGWWMITFWWNNYRLQFILASITLVACILSFLSGKKVRINDTVGLISLCAFYLAIISMIRLSGPFQIHYSHPLRLGWGVIFFIGGSLTAAAFSLYNSIKEKRARLGP